VSQTKAVIVFICCDEMRCRYRQKMSSNWMSRWLLVVRKVLVFLMGN